MKKRHVLVTGATGVVGAALVRELSKEGDSLHLLIRSPSARLLRLETQGARLYRGDVSRPRLGLSRRDWTQLSREITHILHVAGDVRLNLSLRQARAVAVGSMKSLCSLAEESHASGQFEKLDVVSTVGVCGRAAGEVPEARLSRPRAFHNTYEQAKWEAEAYLFSWRELGIPTTVHRPSMVVETNSRRTVSHQVFFYLCELFSGLRSNGLVPAAGSQRLDLISAAYVARALSLSSRLPSAAGRVFHLASGRKALEIGELASRARRHFKRAGLNLPAIRSVPPAEFRRLLPSLSARIPEQGRFFGALPRLLDYLGRPVSFRTERTDAFFRRQGLFCEPADELVASAFSTYWPSEKEAA